MTVLLVSRKPGQLVLLLRREGLPLRSRACRGKGGAQRGTKNGRGVVRIMLCAATYK